jgi:hypothetical protein
MRINNRAHLPWLICVLVATLFAWWLYLGNFAPDRLPAGLRLPPQLVQKPSEHRSVGGTPVGLVFGAVALGIFIFAGLLGVRKKFVLLRIGRVQSWMRAHIWLTLLTIPLVLFHSGFRLGGPMTTVLIVLYVIVMVSGIYGLALQNRLPHVMMERLPNEVISEQIPYIRSRLYVAAQKLRDSFALARKTQAQPVPAGPEQAERPATLAGDELSEAALIEFLDRQVLPYLSSRSGKRYRLSDARFSDDTFRFLQIRVAEGYRARVAEIQSWCDERRMLDLELKMHHWLHAWLFVHVPISFALIGLTGWHAFVTLFYY